ncbi:LapA family protein [Francisella noatunensis]|uniref:LapA family protein n=1 Tax=Francisella noatunensis TaxID=657445 RepID=A0A9Q2KXG2_9GAMM|nr:LapA family protein [Francisella noatunensis]MBK2028983.1 LapA family protein [Francisella noatunensis]MBK2033354.1 LapA family protein [Francisella noatunensis]MBK2048782.1 LapA family protein [Francisella noatunensis]MBK2049535.1 LapA family protein [Francisella noatunensis]MBK2051010.1 LapA family protein [Francisella noatunensis]
MFSTIKKLFWQILFGLAIIVIVFLSILNTDNVSFDYIFGSTTLPLMMLLSIAFVIGLVVGSFITKFIQITKTNGAAKK